MLFRVLLLLLLGIFAGCSSMEESSSEMCFVGDSMTYAWDTETYFPEYAIRKHAISGSTIENVMSWNIQDCKGIPTVMLIGTNNVGFGYLQDSAAEIDFIDKYITLAKSLDASKLYAISILPRNREHGEPKSINEQIYRINGFIEKALQKSKIDHKFIDIYEEFLDDDGELHWDYYSDGLHLSQEGYEFFSFKILGAM